MKTVKYLIRYLIIGAPIYGTYNMIKHLFVCPIGLDSCIKCDSYLIFAALILTIVLILVLGNFVDIWEWIWNEDE